MNTNRGVGSGRGALCQFLSCISSQCICRSFFKEQNRFAMVLSSFIFRKENKVIMTKKRITAIGANAFCKKRSYFDKFSLLMEAQ